MTRLNKNDVADVAGMVAFFAVVTLAVLILLTAVPATGGEYVDRFLAEQKNNPPVPDEIRDTRNARITAFVFAVTGIFVTTVAMMLYRYRRKIAANLSARWRRRSKAFRTWVFTSMCWAIGVFFYVFLAEPYAEPFINEEMTGGQIILHMFSVMLIPPLYFGGAWFGYKRFVE